MTVAEDCATFFKTHAANREKIHEMRSLKEEDLAAWEKVSAVPELSPGPVSNEEWLARRIFHPNQVSDDGVLTPSVFDDLFNKGFSTDRVSHLPEERLTQLSVAIASARNQNYRGAMMAHVEKIRALRTDKGLRVAFVFDTASDPVATRPADQPESPIPELNLRNPAHADICCSLSTKLEKRQARLHVWEAFKPSANERLGFTWLGA